MVFSPLPSAMELRRYNIVRVGHMQTAFTPWDHFPESVLVTSLVPFNLVDDLGRGYSSVTDPYGKHYFQGNIPGVKSLTFLSDPRGQMGEILGPKNVEYVIGNKETRHRIALNVFQSKLALVAYFIIAVMLAGTYLVLFT